MILDKVEEVLGEHPQEVEAVMAQEEAQHLQIYKKL
jgi:hypothetical protein